MDVEGGFADKAKLDEFRAANIALKQPIEDLQARFDGIDPGEVRKLAEEKRRIEEAQQLKAGEFEKVLEARLKTVKADAEKQLAALASERDALNGRLATIQIDQAVVTEATKRGLRPTALPDITARARQTFRLVNGVPQGFESDGQTPRAGRDGVSPLSLAEWLDTQVSDAPHLFEKSAGGGAAGDGSGGVGGQRSVKDSHHCLAPFVKIIQNTQKTSINTGQSRCLPHRRQCFHLPPFAVVSRYNLQLSATGRGRGEGGLASAGIRSRFVHSAGRASGRPFICRRLTLHPFVGPKRGNVSIAERPSGSLLGPSPGDATASSPS